MIFLESKVVISCPYW